MDSRSSAPHADPLARPADPPASHAAAAACVRRPPARWLRALPALAALAYPGAIAAGPRLSPLFLAAAALVPLAGLVAAHRLGAHPELPRARLAAHGVAAAPPLYALLGGWLDFQRAVPVGSLAVWLALWGLVTAAVLLERPAAPAPAPRPRLLAAAHGVSAAALSLFAAAHLANHLGGVAGGEAHTAIMRALRTVYRDPRVEPALLALLGFQVATGAGLLRRRLSRASRGLEAVQSATGAYLLLFLGSHLSAVLRARHLRGVDTNWAWLAGGELLRDPWSARLVPYYFLAVVALGAHGACGLVSVLRARGMAPGRGRRLVAALTALAAAASAAILAGLFRA